MIAAIIAVLLYAAGAGIGFGMLHDDIVEHRTGYDTWAAAVFAIVCLVLGATNAMYVWDLAMQGVRL